jgi:methylenetetrahydrofolate reductase (NADPH)
MPGGASTIRELIASGGRSFSFEFFPPKTDRGEALLWRAIRELESLRPTFVSVTYGAGGSTRDRTVRVIRRISAETTLTAVGHLTCVGSSQLELRGVVGSYADAGVRNVLALRGDPPGGPADEWRAHPDGLDHADQLVRLVRELGDFCVGVAAFPDRHPESPSRDHDARVLAAKEAAGADFAVTQFFFRADDYARLLDELAARGATKPVLPGIMPITNTGQIVRMAQMSGAELPARLLDRLDGVDDPTEVRKIGVDVATALCADLLAQDVPGLHLYTLNRSTATREIYANLGLGAAVLPTKG